MTEAERTKERELEDVPHGSIVKNLPANAGDVGDAGSILGSGRSFGDLVFLPGNSMDRGA